MPASIVPKAKRAASGGKTTAGLLYFLDASGGRIVSVKPDGSDKKVIVTGVGPIPDGIVVDAEAGHLYWTNMGNPIKNDGFIERADLDGKNRTTIIPEGGTFTPKQLHLEKKSGKLYWCDREGMRVMRCNLDGSKVETLVDSSQGDPRPGPDATKWCVGITVDPERGKIYWTQKGPTKGGSGRIFRANIEIPKGETAANRSDIEVLFDKLPDSSLHPALVLQRVIEQSGTACLRIHQRHAESAWWRNSARWPGQPDGASSCKTECGHPLRHTGQGTKTAAGTPNEFHAPLHARIEPPGPHKRY
jgi:hypothetical protein